MQQAPLPPDLRFPPDTIPQASSRRGEWLFWVIPSGDNAPAGCYSTAESEFNAKWAAHNQCSTVFAGRTYYSVGGCSAPQRLAYATSADGNFSWRVCADARRGTSDNAQAEAVKLCEANTGQSCTAGRL